MTKEIFLAECMRVETDQYNNFDIVCIIAEDIKYLNFNDKKTKRFGKKFPNF